MDQVACITQGSRHKASYRATGTGCPRSHAPLPPFSDLTAAVPRTPPPGRLTAGAPGDCAARVEGAPGCRYPHHTELLSGCPTADVGGHGSAHAACVRAPGRGGPVPCLFVNCLSGARLFSSRRSWRWPQLVWSSCSTTTLSRRSSSGR